MADRPPPKEDALARWSRRKQDARDQDAVPAESDAQDTPASLENQSEKDREADVVASLPPVESLTAESDFTPFLDRAVPAELRRMALRKLWLSDPVFANLDGLNDYDDDFRTLGVGKIVRTAYQVGKGIVTKAEKAAAEIQDDQANESATTNVERQAATNAASDDNAEEDGGDEA